MGINLGNTDITGIKIGNQDVTKVYIGSDEVRPANLDFPYLCFTAEQANSTIQLSKTGTPTDITLETSTNGVSWSDYTFGTDITLASIGDKVYWRNKSATPTGFSTTSEKYYKFVATGLVSASGDLNYLLCKTSTDTLQGTFCYYRLFYNNTSLTTAPQLTATTLTTYCYYQMFYGCTALTTINSLPATTMQNYCYYGMYNHCSSLKIASSSDSDYTQEWRIPSEGTGTDASSWNIGMIGSTGGTYTAYPMINTTYYLHKDNTIV